MTTGRRRRRKLFTRGSNQKVRPGSTPFVDPGRFDRGPAPDQRGAARPFPVPFAEAGSGPGWKAGSAASFGKVAFHDITASSSPGGDLRFLLREIARLRRILREIVELRIASIEIDEEFPVPLDRGEVGLSWSGWP